MIEATALLVVGLALLVWSADRLVFGAAALARNVGISPLVIGMTILAMGSSAPEMVVSATAALNDKTNTAVGNVIGSNIANIALILGMTALIKPLLISSDIVRRELPLLLVISLIAGAVLWDLELAFHEGVILAGMFIVFLIAMMNIGRASGESDPALAEQEAEIPDGVPSMKATFWIVIGLILLIGSASMVVEGATVIAKAFGMSDLVIGLTIVAVGTSLPELAASIAGVLKGEDDLAVGNIIGSNIFNILAVMGIPGLLNPSMIDPSAMDRDYVVMMALTVILFIFAVGKGRKIGRLQGLFLLACFIGYQGYLFFNIAQ
ncbi:calcium/sodium antiporter [Veronia pacifica]|uniref:Calcium/sodium antiporter n=1 Tax=Veronia pacifica TaxID=1080227 RepID=A0A1C3ELL4_9GAMM|nr:calcium/sodium antiporter [Veronia pacifica]ODA34119.1 calcium/sodium antiporter [Veronia pacifica]